MIAGVRDILIISTPNDLPKFKQLFGDGSQIGLNFSYKEQPKPEGLAQAFIIGRDFIGDDTVCLILGDNIFFGHSFSEVLKRSSKLTEGGIVFGYLVREPERYGVIEFDTDNKVKSIEEKPKYPKSKFAVTGLYFYDNKVVEIASNLKPSKRGELEITDINLEYLRRNKLIVELLGRGYSWLDTGTHEALQQASSYIQAIQERQGLKIACIEEIAYKLGYIDSSQLKNLAQSYLKNDYGEYIMAIAEDGYLGDF
jgi:glucose-1-phosphate thymidylyltransferase